MSRAELSFRPDGPFDPDERALIIEVMDAVHDHGSSAAEQLLEGVCSNVARLDRFGQLLREYPSPFSTEALGRRQRDLRTLVDRLSHSNPSNFEMFLPTRALIARNLAVAEMNFYRSLRYVCAEALPPDEACQFRERVDARVCVCLYARLTDEVLSHIASDQDVEGPLREKAVLALTQIWRRVTYRVNDFFPLLQATWEARRRVPAILGTLLGTAEMFRLLAEGCDPRFVAYLVRPGHGENETEAFREFLFGCTTEKLRDIERKMAQRGTPCISREHLSSPEAVIDLAGGGADPAIAMYEFFLSRHMQAGARRLAGLPGPKRTAEEYVMLHFLEDSPRPSC